MSHILGFAVTVAIWQREVVATSINYQRTQIPLDLIELFDKRLGLGDTFNAVAREFRAGASSALVSRFSSTRKTGDECVKQENQAR